MARPRIHPRKTDKLSPVATNMVALRQARRWTQIQMAEHLGLDLSKIARTEIGILKPSCELVELIMEKLDVSADELFRAPGPVPAKEQELAELMADIKTLDERNLHNVQRLVKTCKVNADQRVVMKLTLMPTIHSADV